MRKNTQKPHTHTYTHAHAHTQTHRTRTQRWTKFSPGSTCTEFGICFSHQQHSTKDKTPRASNHASLPNASPRAGCRVQDKVTSRSRCKARSRYWSSTRHKYQLNSFPTIRCAISFVRLVDIYPRGGSFPKSLLPGWASPGSQRIEWLPF